jgi:PBP1b-binding outer membrane lipoprotein LpoB
LSTATKFLVVLIISMLIAGCSNPRDNFIDAAMEGKEKNKKNQDLMECVAVKLQKELSDEEFKEITEDLLKINKKEITPLEANLKLIAQLTVANLACKI